MSAAQSIIDELKDVETAFEELSAPEVYDINNDRFMQAQDLLRFQARKQQYKKLRDDAWRWLRNNGKNPTKRADYERGDDIAADNPFRWSVQASLVWHELAAELAAASTAPAVAAWWRRWRRRPAWCTVSKSFRGCSHAGTVRHLLETVRTPEIGDCYRPNAQANPYTITTGARASKPLTAEHAKNFTRRMTALEQTLHDIQVSLQHLEQEVEDLSSAKEPSFCLGF